MDKGSGSGDRCTQRNSSHCSAYRCISAGTSLSLSAFCVRTVSHTPRNPGQHRDLQGDADPHRCCGKSLMGDALVGFGVRQHARTESISKRAPSSASARIRVQGASYGEMSRRSGSAANADNHSDIFQYLRINRIHGERHRLRSPPEYVRIEAAAGLRRRLARSIPPVAPCSSLQRLGRGNACRVACR